MESPLKRNLNIENQNENKRLKTEEKQLPLNEKIKDYILKLIIKENHSCPIVQVCFNNTSQEKKNLVAFVGGEQVNVYDNQHFDHFLDLFMKFENVEITENKGMVKSLKNYNFKKITEFFHRTDQ